MRLVCAPNRQQFGPGMFVPLSGVYTVVHRAHRDDHLVTAVKGDLFPACRRCHDDVRFQLWCDSDYLLHDWDLTGPRPLLLDTAPTPVVDIAARRATPRPRR